MYSRTLSDPVSLSNAYTHFNRHHPTPLIDRFASPTPSLSRFVTFPKFPPPSSPPRSPLRPARPARLARLARSPAPLLSHALHANRRRCPAVAKLGAASITAPPSHLPPRGRATGASLTFNHQEISGGVVVAVRLLLAVLVALTVGHFVVGVASQAGSQRRRRGGAREWLRKRTKPPPHSALPPRSPFFPLLLLLLLLGIILQLTCVGASAVSTAGKELRTTGHGKSQVLHLAAFLPYSASSRSNGIELVLVMALEAINADPAVLVNVELRIHTSYTACSKDVAGIALLKQM